MEQSPNYAQGRFRNLYPIRRIRVGAALRAFAGASRHREPRQPIPVVRRSRRSFAKPSPSGLRVTWIGHSSALLELDGRRFLLDPVWSRRASPIQLGGPKRFFDPPLRLQDLPRIHAVVISHDHYDHLDRHTVEQLARTPVRFVVPLGVGAHLERWGVRPRRITELDWWERTKVGGVTLMAVPARHGSGRGMLSLNHTLWASWVLMGPRHRAFFSGDTGYSPTFAEVGSRFGPFDVTMIESGAYNAQWADFHLGPEQAVAAHQDLRGRVFMPIHWGTFVLAPHGWTEPAERVRVAARAAGVTAVIPRPGASFEPTSPPPLTRWWPDNPWQTADQAPVISSRPAGFDWWRARFAPPVTPRQAAPARQGVPPAAKPSQTGQ